MDRGRKIMSVACHPNMQMGMVALTVADLARSVGFYADVLGLSVIEQAGNIAVLGSEDRRPLLVLVEQSGARSQPLQTATLLHFAIRVPTRTALAQYVRRLSARDHVLLGSADHE